MELSDSPSTRILIQYLTRSSKEAESMLLAFGTLGATSCVSSSFLTYVVLICRRDRFEKLERRRNEEPTPTKKTSRIHSLQTSIRRIDSRRSTTTLDSSISHLDMANRSFERIRIEDTSELSSSNCRALDSRDCD